MTIFYSPQFIRSFKKLPSHIKNIYEIKEKLFISDPFHPELNTHELKSGDRWAFWVTYKIRVVFIFKSGNVILVNTGDHSIYR
jgi:mRNA-degrading endonuclease YafQ of YafQ-DinJ toxin-antitoxin module